jgi:predicted metalloprotease with PDZ domain
MPDLKRLFKTVGVNLSINSSKVNLGVSVRHRKLLTNPKNNSSAYHAGLQKGDKLLKISKTELTDETNLNELLNSYKVNDEVEVVFERFGEIKTVQLTLLADTSYSILLMETAEKPLDKKQRTNRENWLGKK